MNLSRYLAFGIWEFVLIFKRDIDYCTEPSIRYYSKIRDNLKDPMIEWEASVKMSILERLDEYDFN